MKKTTVSLVGLMDLGTLDALKSVTVLKNPCVPTLNNEANSSAKLFNTEVQDKSGLIHEKPGQPISACL
jgi:hypothetical protein